ncbi:dimethylargininase [Homoserinimonas sp. OAct 916]|uniref:dimethylargininase n=1 Tax=Homoserinimonas sp. OAct 916 TaxID=2211450 RepID=UPI000DBE8808|nr:dimethylargininase [Homoserinimonas sp. OAct 916]
MTSAPTAALSPTAPQSWARRIAASGVSALAVALAAHAITVIALFIGNQTNSQMLLPISDFFALPTVFVFILVAVLAIFSGLRWWYTALVGGLLAGIIAVVVGNIITAVVGAKAEVSGELFLALLDSIIGINLVFVLATGILTATLARVVYSAMLRQGTQIRAGQGRTALIRVPASNLNAGELTHIERVPVDADLADSQWDNYVNALHEAGWQTVEVPPAPEMADSVFVEDTVVMFGRTAVITNPGTESRQGEIVDVEATVRGLGLPVLRIEAPGTLDGGDVLKVGQTVFVGRGGRTNGEGIRQLRALVAPLGFTVVAVPLTRVLHLKSAVTALPDGTVIGYGPVVDDPTIFGRYLDMPEEAGAHVVILADDTVLMATSAPKSVALIEDLGYRVITVDISEFEKLEGCVTCLSVRIR